MNPGVGCHAFLQGSSWPGDRTWVSYVSCMADGFFTTSAASVSSVSQSCPTLCEPMDCSTPGLPVHHQLLEFTQTHVLELVMPFNHLILCRPLLLLPSIFPSIRVFSNESVLHIRWPQYWSFSLSISPSNEHSRLISFRMDWLDVQKHLFFGAQLSL